MKINRLGATVKVNIIVAMQQRDKPLTYCQVWNMPFNLLLNVTSAYELALSCHSFNADIVQQCSGTHHGLH